LTNKINDTNGIDVYGVYHPSQDHSGVVWHDWLIGAHVGYIFAAANRIGARGFATQQLDTALRAVIAHFEFGQDAGNPCSKEGANNCVDDYSVDAPGFAWIAAYKYRRGDDAAGVQPNVQHYRDRANDMINAAFNEVCIRMNDGEGGVATTLCNGTVAALRDGRAHTLSVNHGPQMPSYGFGLMTSIANAELGLEASGSGHYFDPDQVTIAQGLLTEMKNAFDNTTGEFSTTACVTIHLDPMSGVWTTTTPSNCAGPDGYKAGMYNLHRFYVDHLGGYPAGGYQSDTDNPGLFVLGDQSGFFSWGRYLTYSPMASSWFDKHSTDYLPFDDHNPIGYLDSVNANGLASGWSCDQDAPKNSNKVDIYANGVFAATDYATLPSEAAVNSLCGDGTAHRFQAQLPPSARGTTIIAYGLDYTWFGFTPLSCVTTCSWPDNPPTASFGISCIGRSCTANGGGSSDDVGINGYQWNWGDGQTGTGSTASHTFAVNGTYTVTLTVTDTIGQTNATSHTVNASDNPPAAAFVIPCTGRTCTGNAGASTDDVGISGYQWTWGDGQFGSGVVASHSYAVNGTYSVTLTVTDTIGQTNSVTHSVTVTDNPPVASFTISCTSLVCSTNGTASSDDLGVGAYSWNWGDNGAGNTGSTASHTFAGAGTYVVTLTVSDTIGQTNSTTRTVTVAPCTAPAISTQPTASPATISNGGSSTLAISVNGTAPLTVQWYTLSGTGVGSGTSISVSPAVTTTYYAIVSNACGSVQSMNVTVTMCSPGLGTAPTATPSTISAGQVSRLDMGSATGQATLTYLWYKSDGTLVATTTAKKINVTPTVTTSYYYKVTNSCGTTGASPTVTVTVQ
jgi:PKD repeat protein